MENISLINVTAKNVKVINIQDSWHRINLDNKEILWHKERQLFIQENFTPSNEAFSSGCCQSLNGLGLYYIMTSFICHANKLSSHQTSA